LCRLPGKKTEKVREKQSDKLFSRKVSKTRYWVRTWGSNKKNLRGGRGDKIKSKKDGSMHALRPGFVPQKGSASAGETTFQHLDGPALPADDREN